MTETEEQGVITDEQVKQLEELGYEVGVAYLVARDPDDPESPVDKPVYFARAGNVTHYVGESDAVDVLIKQGAPDA